MAFISLPLNEKIFLGFSDTTINHLMLHKLGVKTFYGQSFLADLCELDKEYRGRGVGTRLMEEMLSLLKQQGYKRASLAVQKANYAVRIYKRVGFHTVDENEEEYIMVCEL